MPQYLPLPDGSSVTIREGESPQQAYERARKMYPEAFGAQPKPPAETTIGGGIKELFKGLAPGAIGLAESAAIGASALLPEETEKAVAAKARSLAQAARAPFAAAPGYEDSVLRKLGEAGGSTLPFFALGPFGLAGRAGMAALGTGAGAGEARTRAEQEGATADERGTATALGAVVGVSEMFAPMRILGRVAEPAKQGAAAMVKRAMLAGGEEAAQEAAAQAAQNMIAKGIYKPEQEIIESVGESAAYGGAVGAIAQGLLDLAIGRRAKGATTQDEIKKAREEADATAAAEAERKATPEYAQQFVADYEARKEQFVEARKALQRPAKDATPDVWEAYKEQQTALKELQESLRDDAKEYNALAPKIKAEEKRAAMQPEDALLEQLGMQVVPPATEEAPKTRMEVDEFGQVTEVPAGVEAQEPVAAPQQYLTQQVEAARGFGQLSLADYADFAMQDPQMAAEAVKSRVRVPGLTTAENNALLSGINQRLKEAERQRAAEAKALYEQRSADLKAQQPTPEITNELAGIEQYLAEIAERGPAQVEPTFEYLDPIFEQAFNQPPTIKISDKVQPIKNAPAIRDRIESLMQEADQADRDYQIARFGPKTAVAQYGATREGRSAEAALAARKRKDAALQQIEALSTEGNEYSKEFLAARKGQNEAIASLQDVVDQLRTGQTLGGRSKEMAASTEQTLTSKAEQLRAQLITNALQEAALHRRAAGQSQITQDEAIKAASKLYDTVDTLIERAKVKSPAEELNNAEKNLQPVRERVDKNERTVRSYKLLDTETNAPAEITIVRQKDGTVFRVFSRYLDGKGGGTEFDNKYDKSLSDQQILQKSFINTEMFTLGKKLLPGMQQLSPAEIKHFAERIDAVRRQLIEPPKGEAARVEPALKTQFAATEAAKVAEARGETAETLGGELRRRTEFVRDKMAKMGGMRPMARDVLNKAADVMDAGRASKDLLDAVEPVVDAITSKRQVTQTDLRAVNDALKAAEPTAAEQQAQGQQALNLLFEEPGQRPRLVQKDLGFIRKNFQNFENSPALQKARMFVERAKKLAKQMAAKRAQEEQARKEAVKKESKAQERRVLTLERAVRQQRSDLQQAVYDAIKAERQALTDAQRIASAPAIKAAEQAVADAEKLLKDMEQRLETLTENIQFPGMDAVKKEKARIRGRIGVQQTIVQSAKSFLAQVVAESQVQYESAAVVARANQDSLVQFERKALEQFEKRLEKLRKQSQVPNAELAAAQKAADEQRARVATEERGARDAAEKANKEQRELEQRRLSGLGLPGVKRVAGEVVEIEAAKDAELTKALAEAYERSKQAQDAVAGVKQAIPQVPRATGPVARGVRTQVGKLTQARTPKQPEVETAVAEANVLAAERAAQQPEKTAVEKRQDAAQQQQQMREAKERLENTIRGQLADVNIRIEAMEKANKLNPERIKELEEERASLQRQLVAARQDIEKEGELEKKAQRELKKEQRAQAKREAEEDVQFSRGTPAQGGQTISELEQSLDRALGEKGLARRRINLFESVATFLANPKYKYEYSSADVPTDAKAFVDPKTGDVFMFANNIAKNESVGVLLHEVGVHIGFRKLFGAARYNALVQTVKNWATRKDGSLESKIAQRALARVEAAETSAEQVDDELLAYAVEEAVKAGVEPSAFKKGSPLQNWLQVVLDTLRKALSAFGIDANKLTSGDLVNMAYGAAQMEVRGTWHGSDAKFTAFDTKTAGRGEGAFDRRFDFESSIGEGPYTTPQQDYAEYYQYAVPFGKAANSTGYGGMSYQDYRALDEKLQEPNAALSPTELKQKFESRLLTAYLQGVSNGESLNPAANASAKNLIKKLTAGARNVAEKQAVATLDLGKLKKLTERPAIGQLYAALDAMPRSQVFEINSMQTVGDRPKVDALLRKYGDPFDVSQAEQDNKYPGNSLFYRMQRELGTKETVRLFKDAGIRALERNVEGGKKTERAYIEQAPDVIPLPEKPIGPAKGLLFSRAPAYASPEMAAVADKLDPFVTKQRGVTERVRAAAGGFLGLETQLVDRFAGFERLSKYLPEHLGTQMMYYLRMYDQRMNMVSQAVANGAPSLVTKTRKDGKTERLIEAKEGPNIKRTVEILREANPMVGNAEAVNRLFTAYMAGIRADNKGFDTLNFGEDATPEMLKDALSVVNNNPALKKIFDNARSEYNAYNRNLVEFLVETGAVSQDVANRLMAENDYIPFYRERGGVAELLIGKEAPIKIGSIKEQPYLQQLVGGDQPILDFLTSSVQNTNFLVDMGMRNLATKNAIYELVDLNAAKIVGGTPSGTNVVKFKDKGVDKYAVLATEKVKIGNKEFETGVPADILVKGMEGVPTQMPALLRAFALPAQLLRKGVTLSPLYVARQVFRDSLAAPILAGANFTPVLGALKQIGKPTKGTLERRGITGGQQFTGTSDDLSMILRDVADGKPGWMSLLAKAEGVAMSADALTRRAQYNSYIEQGMSEMEATLMALESMNFSKRGASPSIQIANSLIPFFNAQIQGLNVMYKALAGKMPLNDKLKIRQKLLQRGGMMAAASMIYAIMMQDDEAYKNAEADQKYANWFVRIPGVDEPVRIPIPFEVGYLFKALPEAIVNSMASQEGGEQALKALRQIVIQSIPGGSSYGIPQALKPAIEAGLGKSFYTGRDILSAREKELLPEEQFRTNTAEISKLIGQVAGVSPIMLENLVRGYTGTMGLAFLHALSLGVPPGEGPDKAVKRLSEYPVVGGAFQPNDAGGIVNSVYERMNDALKVSRTYEKLTVEGRAAEANALLQRKGQEFMQAELANEFKANMNQLVAAERAVQASSMSAEEKRKQLDEIRKLKIAVAKEVRDVADKTIRLSFSL